MFADIMNVLLFDGKRVVHPRSLQDATTVSQYKFDDKLHEQERDVAKFFVAQRTGRKVEFSSRELKHVDEILKLLQAVSKEEDITNLFRDEGIDKVGKVNMGNLFRRYKNEGIKEGRAEGRVEGRAEGRVEGFVAVAMEMIKEKTPISMIQKFTKLSLEQLQKLSEECGVALVM